MTAGHTKVRHTATRSRHGHERGRSRTSCPHGSRAPALALALTVSLVSLGASCGRESAGPATTAPSGTVVNPGTGPEPGPATSVPTTPSTTTTTIPPSTETTVAWATTTAPPAGTPLPGGPVRTPYVAPPAGSGACTETQGRTEHLTFQSNVLLVEQAVQRYRVYLPACYRWNTTTAYPVLYLMHGANADESQWDDLGAFTTADRLIAQGAIPPMIIVLVDGIWAMGTYEYEPPLMDRFMLGEVMPAIEQDFRTITTSEGRAIGGISRGGEWALILGGRHPDLFGAVGGHSPAAGDLNPTSSFVARFAGRSAGMRIWIDVGASDSLAGLVGALHQAFAGAGIAHEYRLSPGGHDRAYWASQVEAYLRFYASSWAPATVPAPVAGGAR